MNRAESHRLTAGNQKVAGETLVRRRQRDRDPPLLWVDKGISLIDASHVEFEQSFLLRKRLSDEGLDGIDILIKHGPDKGGQQHVRQNCPRAEAIENVINREIDDAKASLRNQFPMMLRELPPGRHVQHNPSRFQFLHIQLETVMIERDKHIHLCFGAADALIRDVQLIARMPALDERGIFTVAEHAISGSFETFGDNRANGVYSLSGSADDFERYAGHRLTPIYLLRSIHQLFAPNSYCLLLAVGLVYDFKRWNNQPAMIGRNVVLQMIRRSRRVEVSMVSQSDARTRFAGQIQSLRLVMEQHPHVWIQLPLDAPCIPGRRCEQENISAQQILWLRFLGHHCLDLPAWGNALQRIGQCIHYVLRVTASRGKDDMEDSTLNEVRDSIGGVVHELPPPPMLLAQGSGHGSRTAAHPRRHCAKGHGLVALLVTFNVPMGTAVGSNLFIKS